LGLYVNWEYISGHALNFPLTSTLKTLVRPLGLTLGWNLVIIHLVLDGTGNIACI